MTSRKYSTVISANITSACTLPKVCEVHAYDCCVFAQAIGVPDAIPTLAKIANEMIIQTNCSALQPLFHDLYPAMFSSPQSLDLNITQLSAIPAEAPRLAQCALKGT